MTEIVVALLQQQCSSNIESNMQQSLCDIREAAKRGAKLVCLPELFRSIYFCQEENTDFFDLAETIPGPSTDLLCKEAEKLKIVIIAPLFEKRAAGIYHNTAVVIDQDGSIAGKYRKMHIPDDPGFYEKFYFTPGDLGFKPIQTSIGKIGLLICWDQWFPEAARLMALAGAELLIYPTAIGWDETDTPDEQKRQHDAWRTIQRSHAIANGLPVLSINRVGVEKGPDNTTGINFWGGSFACGPQGEMLAEGPHDAKSIEVVPLDMKRGEAIRRIWPYFRDRRVDHYQSLDKLFID